MGHNLLSMDKFTRIVVISFWSLFLIGILAIAGFFCAINNGTIGYLPPIEELENPKDKYASIIFTSDSVEIGRFSQAQENRVHTQYNQLSPYLVQALISTEDERFADHSGIDFKAVFRAIIKTVFLGDKSAGGGSTITQQLAKQLYSPDSKGFWSRAMQKPIEWVIATKLEKLYTKEEIINMYLDHFDFSYNAVGIRSACHIYFDKLPKDVEIQEAALLVGMLQNPSLYNPIRRPERTMQRRSIVLMQMEDKGFISKAQHDSLDALPLLPQTDKSGRYRLANSADHKSGLAPYLREYLRKILRAKEPRRSDYASWQDQQYSEDSLAWLTNPLYGWCEKNRKPDGSRYNLTTDGLRIYTSLDSRMQRYAEEAVVEQLRDVLQPQFNKEKAGQKNAPYSRKLSDADVQNSLRRAMRQSDRYLSMARSGYSKEEIEEAFKTPVPMKVFSWEEEAIDTIMTPWDSLRWQKQFLRAGFMCMDTLGYVKAYVGGPDFQYFQYDMVTAGRRQVGSTIKPLLYALAMEEGRTPCDQELNAQPTLYDAVGRAWTPRNTGRDHIGEMVTLHWGLMTSNNWISARVMSRLSPEAFVRFLHSAGIRNRLDPVLSLCLGVCDLSVEEMVTAYSAFPGRGQHVTPLYVRTICDNNGMQLTQFVPKKNEVFSVEGYLKMIPILKDVINRGTGGRIRSRHHITAEMGGKTGTTNDNSDGWFMSFTPSLVTGCWVGGEERSISFDRMAYGQGASMALPIAGNFWSKVFEDKTLPYSQNEKFFVPEGYDPCSGGAYLPDVNAEQYDSGIFD